MRRMIPALLLLLAPLSATARQHAMTREDVWLLHRIGTPALGPDGKTLAFTARRNGDEADQIYLLPLESGEARRLTSIPTGASGPKFRSEGRAILFQATFIAGASTLDEQKKLADGQKARKDTART